MKLKKNVFGALAFRASQALAWALFVRFVLLNYGAPAYGLLAVMLSIITWLQLFDLGIISYLRTKIPQMRARNAEERDVISLLIDSAIRTSISFSLIIVLILLISKISPEAFSLLESKINFDKTLTGFSLTSFVYIILFYGQLLIISQFLLTYFSATYDQFKYYIVAILGIVSQLTFSYAAAKHGIDVFYLFSGFLLTSLVPQLSALFWIFYRARFPFGHSRLEHGTSILYFFCQIGGMLCYNLDVVFVSNLFTLRDAAVYGTLKNITQIIISFHAIIMQQSWPKLSKSFQCGDEKEFLNTINLCERITFILIPIFIACFTVAMPFVVKFWTSNKLGYIPFTLSFGFSVFGSLFILSSLYGTVVMATAHLRVLVWLAWSAAFISTAVIMLTHARIGLYSVLCGLSSAALIGLVGCYVLKGQLLRQLRCKTEKSLRDEAYGQQSL